jgi:hypothetical protein
MNHWNQQLAVACSTSTSALLSSPDAAKCILIGCLIHWLFKNAVPIAEFL